MNRIFFIIILLFSCTSSMAQFGRTTAPSGIKSATGSDDLSYLNPKEYVIGGVTVTGAQFLDKDVLINISKLTVGDRITVPGDATSNAIKKLWEQQLFEDVQLNVADIRSDSIFFEIAIVERARLTRIEFKGLKKSETEDINKKLTDKTGKVVNENMIKTTTGIIKKHFIDKGYLFTEVTTAQVKDTSEANNVILKVQVNKNSKVKVNHIAFEGNKDFKDKQLRKFLKKTKQREIYKVFGSGKFSSEKYEKDKETLIAKMQDKGYRDASIIKDTVSQHNSKSVNIDIKLNEGVKYYFGNITWAGNAKYPTKVLEQILTIKKGEVFSEEKLNKKLNGSPDGGDVSSLYLNDGYLTYNVDPVQTRIYGDTIDIEMRMYEGPQYTINKVILKGNDITHDKVVLRE
ncbi:MAG: outer membrane protein assembly factor BamA, partial [Daejeonella sp.]|nr:outer membrane protein assembly factor BamA [Daejeonella sp.]